MMSLSAMTVMFLLMISMSFAAEEGTKVEGTWHFNAPDAPYDYQTGDIVIKKENGKYTGTIVFSEYYKLETKDFKVVKNVVSFKAYVEGDVIYFKGTVKGKKMDGKVSYSEGTLNISAEKVTKKK